MSRDVTRSNDQRIERHPMYTPSDLAYLRSHGYDDAEITAFWERDRRLGKEPLHHRPIPDVIGRLLGEGRPDRPDRHQT
ncbi:MAG: hypothetical protein JWN40_3833 [Phycisphaerales bacterium]|nr:hypothetical protein [Phycisphaerales bacterium]